MAFNINFIYGIDSYLFPSTVVPAVWFDGNQQAFSDLAGTIPVSTGLIRSINDGATGTAVWTTSADNQRPFRDSNSLRFELNGSAAENTLVRPAISGIKRNNCTVVVSFVPRDSSYGGAMMGLFFDDTANVGVRIPSDAIWVWYNGTNYFTALSQVPGVLNTIVIRYTSTTIDIKLNAGGVITTDSISGLTIPATDEGGNWYLGSDSTNGFYGSISQAMVIARTVSDSERDALLAWAGNQIIPPAYPNNRTLFSYVGDSITRMTACQYGLGYPFLCLEAVKTAGFVNSENCDTAIGGSGVTGILVPSINNPFTYSTPFYSSARAKNIMVVLLGTNDLANNNGVAYTLYGTGGTNSGLYPMCDAARAQGWKVVLLTIGPRSNVMSVSQGTYNSQRAAANADILTNGLANHADRVVDTTGIVNFGIDGDSNNGTYYSADLIHPLNTAHALLAPYVTAALLSLM
jgi:hypothetical protein